MFYGVRWLASRSTPNLEGQGFSVGVFLPLVRLFEGAERLPLATVAQLLATASITRSYGDDDLRHMTSLAEPILDGESFLSIYGESIGDSC